MTPIGQPCTYEPMPRLYFVFVQIRVRGCVVYPRHGKIRERAFANRTGIGAHLFGLESPRVLEMLGHHRNALALGDEYLMATAPTFL